MRSRAGLVDKLRKWAQPAFSIPLFLLGLLGAFLLPGRLALLGVALLVYQTLVAMGFAGATRYRVPWDFLIALAAAAAVWWVVDRRRQRHVTRVVHIHRIRGIGGSERHVLTLLPALAAEGIEPVFLGLDDPDWPVEPFYRELDVESVRLECPRDLDPRARAAGAARAGAAPAGRRPHASRARGRLRRARSEARRPGRLDEAQRRPVPARAVPVRRARADAPGGARDRDHRGAAAVLHRPGRPAAGQGRGRPLRARRAARAVGREPGARPAGRRAGAAVRRAAGRAEGRRRRGAGARAGAGGRAEGGAGRPRRGAGAAQSGRRGRLPSRAGRRRRAVVPACRAARPPRPLGGVRARPARGDARRRSPSWRRGSARCRRSWPTARPGCSSRRTTRTPWRAR